MKNRTKISAFAFAFALIAAASSSLFAGARDDIEPAKLRQMKEEILTAARQIAAKYGNPAFSIIVTSEDERADQVKKRLAEMQKIDAAEAVLKDMEGRIKNAEAEAQAKESYIAAMDLKLKGAELAVADAERRAGNSATPSQPIPPGEMAPVPQGQQGAPQLPPPPKDNNQSPSPNAQADSVLRNLGIEK